MRILFLLLLSFHLHAASLTPVVVSAGSTLEGGGNYFPNACNGVAYFLVEKVINAYVTKTYLFIAANAPAVDAWLYTDIDQIIGEVHRPVGFHPVNQSLRYWEAERDFGNDSVWVGKVWILAVCYGGTSIEPYAIVYTRGTP